MTVGPHRAMIGSRERMCLVGGREGFLRVLTSLVMVAGTHAAYLRPKLGYSRNMFWRVSWLTTKLSSVTTWVNKRNPNNELKRGENG